MTNGNFIWQQMPNGDFMCGGKVYPCPKLPDGRNMEVFKLYPARLLIDLHTDEPNSEGDRCFGVGSQVEVGIVPSGRLDIMDGHLCLKLDAVAGTDFEFI